MHAALIGFLVAVGILALGAALRIGMNYLGYPNFRDNTPLDGGDGND